MQNISWFAYLHPFEYVDLLIVAQLGQVLLNGQFRPGRIQAWDIERDTLEYCAKTEASTLSELMEAGGFTFYSLTELVQVMHWTILT